MFDQNGNFINEATGFLKGENKPTVVFEFSYYNLTFILLGLILTLVVSQLIVNAVTNKQ